MDLAFIWSWIAIWLACIWVAIGQWFLTYKAMQMIGKNPNMNSYYLTAAILWIALVESAAIYGLILSFQIMSNPDINGLSAIGIGLAIGLAWLGVWIWEWKMIGWAMQAMNINPENKNKIMTFMILFLALIESAAIYGLVMAIQMLNMPELSWAIAIWAWLAVGLAWLGVWIWEWILAERSLISMWEKIEMSWFFLTVSILGIALVESAAIYGLIIAFQLLWVDSINSIAAIWAWLAVGLAWLGVWIWEWKLISAALDAMKHNPQNKAKIMTMMILFLALVESSAIYGLIVAFQIMHTSELNWFLAIWSWLAIGLAWLWVWIWEWILAQKSLHVMWKKQELQSYFLTVTILWIALVESAAIYGLIFSMKLLAGGLIDPIVAIWIGCAIWFAWLWVAIWEWLMVSGAFESMSLDTKNKNKYMTYMILSIALIESAAIYALVLWFQMIWMGDLNWTIAIGVGLAVGLAGLWVWVWEWIMAKKAIETMAHIPQSQWFILTMMILWIALVESAAIYSLIVSFQSLSAEFSDGLVVIGIWLAVWLAWLWVWVWEWKMVSWAFEWIASNPESKSKIMTYMILLIALIESAAIYALILWFQMLNAWDLTWAIAIWAGCAIWFAWLWVWIWEGLLGYKSLKAIWKRIEHQGFYLTVTILWIALVESAVIYGLIVALQILWDPSVGAAAIGIGLAVGLAWLGVWIWEWSMLWSWMDAIVINNKHRSRILTYMILFLALVESAAIYGLIISFQMFGIENLPLYVAIWAGVAIWLAGLWVGWWEWLLAGKSIEMIWKTPQMQSFYLTITILGVALVESAAIYGLVVAIQLLSIDFNTVFVALAWWLSIGLAALGAGLGEWILVSGVMDSIHRNPANKSKSLAFMVLFLALIEVLAIYGLIVAFQIIWK